MVFKRRKPAGVDIPDQASISEAGPPDFDLFYEKYVERIYNYCLRRVGQTQEAEDLASVIFTRAWSNRAAYRGGSEAAWLFKIAHNTVANHRRDRKPQVSLDVVVTNGGDYPAGPDEDMLDKLIRQENRAELAALVQTLNPGQRELLALSVAGGLTAREVGEVLGKSEAAVWMAFHRIIRRLRATLANQAEPEKEKSR